MKQKVQTQERPPTRRRWAVIQIVAVVVVVLAVKSSLADHYHVPTGSMEFTIMPGDRVLVNKTAYGIRVPFTDVTALSLSQPERGEVVIFDSPDRPGTTLIKRVVAVPGDRVALTNGRLMINGQPVADAAGTDLERFGDRLAKLNLQHGGGPDIRPSLVPEGMLLVLGDHRGRSHDGRFFGLIPQENVLGRAVGVFYRQSDGITWRRLSG